MPPGRVPLLWRAASAVVGAVFLLAVAGKAWEFPRFRLVVHHVLEPAFPSPAVTIVAMAVVAWEAFLAVCFWWLAPRRWTLWATVGTLTVFSVVLFVLWRDPLAPACGCLGVPAPRAPANSDAPVGLARNAALPWILAWMIRDPARPGRSSPTAPSRSCPASPPTTPSSGTRTAFTLIEVLMTIGVIALLLALTLPALFRMRRNAEFVRSLATHREIASSLQLYAADHRGAFPYFMTEGDPLGPKRFDGFDLPVPYFRAGHVFWPNLVVPDYFSSDLPFFMAIPPDREAAVERNLFDGYPPQTIRSRYFMTDTAFAAPEYWATDDTPSDLGLLRGTLLSDVRFPANKGLTVDMLTGAFSDRDRDGFVDPDATPLAAVGLGDGSARTVPWSDATHDLSRVVERPFGALPWPIFSTRGGLAGTDF